MTYPIPSAKIFSTETQTVNGALNNKANAVVNLNISRDVTEEKLVEYSEKNNEDNPYEEVLLCRNSEQVKQDKMTTFYEEVLNAYMNNPIYINQKVLMKTSNLANLVKELCDADEVNIELGCDISCCGKPTQYNTVENIVVVKNKERTDFKVSHNEWYRKLKDYRISLNFTID